MERTVDVDVYGDAASEKAHEVIGDKPLTFVENEAEAARLTRLFSAMMNVSEAVQMEGGVLLSNDGDEACVALVGPEEVFLLTVEQARGFRGVLEASVVEAAAAMRAKRGGHPQLDALLKATDERAALIFRHMDDLISTAVAHNAAQQNPQ